MNNHTHASRRGAFPALALFVLLMLVLILACTGCVNMKQSGNDLQIVQAALNVILPPGYRGGLKGDHDGYYFGTSVHFEFDLQGLRQVGGRWTWTGGGYKRKGFFSQGSLTLTPDPAPLVLSPE